MGQGKIPKVHAKQKGFKNFFNFRSENEILCTLVIDTIFSYYLKKIGKQLSKDPNLLKKCLILLIIFQLFQRLLGNAIIFEDFNT